MSPEELVNVLKNCECSLPTHPTPFMVIKAIQNSSISQYYYGKKKITVKIV